MNRRQVLIALAGAPFALGAAPQRRVRGVAMVWELAQTMIALGTPPIAVAEENWYRLYAATPPLPPGTIDVGLRVEPNLELLASLRPDFIAINSQQTMARPQLEKIAPVEWLPIHTRDGRPYEHASRVARRLAELVDDPRAGIALCARVDAAIDVQRRRLRRTSPRPVYAVSFEGQNVLRVYGTNSIAGGVFDRMGIRNAWTKPLGLWGFDVVGMEEIAAEPEAHVICLNGSERDLVPDLKRLLDADPLWNALPCVRAGRVTIVDESIWITGGSLPVAERFARIVGNALVPFATPGVRFRQAAAEGARVF